MIYPIAMYDPDTGEIFYTLIPNENGLYVDGNYYDDLRAKIDTEGFFLSNDCQDYYYDGTNFVEKGIRPSAFHDFNWSTKVWDLDLTRFWKQIRQERDGRLFACDWTQMTDAPLTTEKKAEWVTYRQALRDVPSNNSSVTDYDTIVWPTKPS
jgi:hypothetical protein